MFETSTEHRRRVSLRWLAASAALTLAAALVLTASADGTGAPFEGAPPSQSFPDFGPCPIAPSSSYLPAGVGCVTARRAEVEDGGEADLLLLYAHLNSERIATGFVLKVVTPNGAELTANVPRSELNATIATTKNVNASPGVEIFVHQAHITTEEVMGIYSFQSGRLVVSGALPYAGEDAGIRFGFTCHTSHPASIVEHRFEERTPFKGVWERTDTTYRWKGAKLVRGATSKAKAKPKGSEVGPHCFGMLESSSSSLASADHPVGFG